MAAGPRRLIACEDESRGRGLGWRTLDRRDRSRRREDDDDQRAERGRGGTRPQEQHGAERDQDDPGEVVGAPLQPAGWDEAEEQDGEADDGHRREQRCEPMVPAEHEQCRRERDDLDEREPGRNDLPEHDVSDPDDDGDRHEPEGRGDCRSLADPEVRLIGGIRTDVEDTSQVHATD